MAKPILLPTPLPLEVRLSRRNPECWASITFLTNVGPCTLRKGADLVRITGEFFHTDDLSNPARVRERLRIPFRKPWLAPLGHELDHREIDVLEFYDKLNRILRDGTPTSPIRLVSPHT